MHKHISGLSDFFVSGINHKNADAACRGKFSLSCSRIENLMAASAQFHIESFFILSTCNRTEIYGFAENAAKLEELLCTGSEGNVDEFRKLSYTKSGTKAIRHLFEVGAGLDSQVLGDYEIVGQIRQAVQVSKKAGKVDVVLERMVNEAIQATRKIRSTTNLSSGTVSVSFAAVQFAKNFAKKKSPDILLIGTGKIGRNTIKNIRDVIPGASLTIMNRTEDKAIQLATELSLKYTPMGAIRLSTANADVVIVATAAEHTLLDQTFFKGQKNTLVIDLSIPVNVDPAVKDLPNIRLINVDDLTRVKDETLNARKAEIPAAKNIINDHMESFISWYDMRKHVPVLHAVKSKLLHLHSRKSPDSINDTDNATIQKVINGMAVKMRTRNNRGCFFIEAMNDFMEVSSN